MSVKNLDIRHLKQDLRAKKLSVSQIYQEHLALIKKSNSTIKALTYTNEQLDSTAVLLDSEIQKNKSRGRLHGIFFCAKDHIDVENYPASKGNKFTAIKKSDHSANVIKRLLAEGALCIGKSNMSEYGRSYHSLNPDFGLTLNPLDNNYSAGGSSGGDAAAVAAGFCSFAIGSDTGGSVRIPANFCGLYSLYPTIGTVSQAGMSYYPHSVSALTRSVGPICKSLADLELIYRDHK